jgi:hypothetical protein
MGESDWQPRVTTAMMEEIGPRPTLVIEFLEMHMILIFETDS